jgi:hypothetical protein
MRTLLAAAVAACVATSCSSSSTSSSNPPKPDSSLIIPPIQLPSADAGRADSAKNHDARADVAKSHEAAADGARDGTGMSLQDDPNNCGAAGHSCLESTCSGGVCAMELVRDIAGDAIEAAVGSGTLYLMHSDGRITAGPLTSASSDTVLATLSVPDGGAGDGTGMINAMTATSSALFPYSGGEQIPSVALPGGAVASSGAMCTVDAGGGGNYLMSWYVAGNGLYAQCRLGFFAVAPLPFPSVVAPVTSNGSYECNLVASAPGGAIASCATWEDTDPQLSLVTPSGFSVIADPAPDPSVVAGVVTTSSFVVIASYNMAVDSNPTTLTFSTMPLGGGSLTTAFTTTIYSGASGAEYGPTLSLLASGDKVIWVIAAGDPNDGIYEASFGSPAPTPLLLERGGLELSAMVGTDGAYLYIAGTGNDLLDGGSDEPVLTRLPL